MLLALGQSYLRGFIMNKFSKISVLLASLLLSFSVAAALRPGEGVEGLKAELAKIDASDDAAVLAFAKSAKDMGYSSSDFTSAWVSAGLPVEGLATVLVEAFPTAAGNPGGNSGGNNGVGGLSGSPGASSFGSLGGASSFAGGGGGGVSKN